MKGFSHFVSGVAMATCLPGVLESAADKNSMLLVLVGLFSVLPDWLDFKWARYFEPADYHIRPSAAHFDAQAIAEQVAALLDLAYDSRQPVWLQLHTIQLGPDLWQQYHLRFDNRAGEVQVRLGQQVNTGQLFRQATPAAALGRAKINAPLNYTYDGELKIDIFEGPTFEFIRLRERHSGQDAVEVAFLPWHRRWSHSFPLGAFFGLWVGLLFGWLAGVAVFVAFSTHILADQLGFLGSNLFWPFTQRRSNGLHLMHSGDPIPNFLTVWLSVVLVLFNINRLADPPVLDPVWWMVGGGLLPTVLLLAIYIRRKRRHSVPRSASPDIFMELEEPA